LEQVKGRLFGAVKKGPPRRLAKFKKARFFAADLRLAPIVNCAQKIYNYDSQGKSKNRGGTVASNDLC
jgi:hypothetical protein